MKKYLFISLLAFLFSSCMGMTSLVNYVGETYVPTDNVEVYYSPQDVKIDYETMGHAEITCANFDTYVKIAQNDIIKFAQQKGANAVIFDKLEVIAVEDSKKSVIKASFIKYKL